MKSGIVAKAYFNLDMENPLKGMKKMRSHGYDCADVGFFGNTHTPLFECSESEFESQLLFMKKCADEAEIEFIQAHGPWDFPTHDATPEQRAERLEKMQKSIRGCKIIGCPYLVIHPIMPFGHYSNPDPDEFYRLNFEFFSELIKTAEECGVVVCLENMPFKDLTLSTPTEILNFVKDINSPYFKICFDTGHASVFGISCGDSVRLIGKEYLATLHVHDNNGVDDLHLPVFKGVIDWEDFRSALIEIGFEGAVSLETRILTENYGPEDADLVEKLQIELAESALYIAGKEKT